MKIYEEYHQINPLYDITDFFRKDATFQCEMTRDDHGFLCGLISQERPKKIVEIGVSSGGTTVIIHKALESLSGNQKFYSIDLNSEWCRDKKFSTGFLYDNYKNNLAKEHIQHKFIFGHTIAGVIEEIGDMIDFAIIDTTHALPGEMLDFLAIYPFLAPRATVVFHDINLNIDRATHYKIGEKISEFDKDAYATKNCFTTIKGIKFFNYVPVLSNIAAIKITDETKQSISDLFLQLITKWNYIPSDSVLAEYEKIYNIFYSSNHLRHFNCGIELNRKYKKIHNLTETTPLVSVVVPMYQVEQYIRTSVRSVLAQTMQNFELILVDDASPDQCYNICQSEFGQDSRIRLVRHKENQGLSSARNTGLRFSRGKYIYFLDSDDILLPEALETWLEAAERTGADVVHTSQWMEMKWEDLLKNRRMILRTEANGEVAQNLPADMEQRLRQHWGMYATWPMVWLNLYRRDFLIEHDLQFTDMISEDESFAFAVYCFAKKFHKISTPLYIYCKRENSIMGNYSEKRFIQGLQSLKSGMRYLDDTMNRTTYFIGKHALRQELHAFFLQRMMGSHITPFYSNMGNNKNSLEQIASQGISSVFGDNAPLIQWLFQQYHIFREQVVHMSQALTASQQRTM